MRTSKESAFVDVIALIAQRNFHIDAEIVAAGSSGQIQQRQITWRVQLFFQVQMQGGAAI